jgi:hypothetical protein
LTGYIAIPDGLFVFGRSILSGALTTHDNFGRKPRLWEALRQVV